MYLIFLACLAMADEFSIANQTIVHQELSNGLDVILIDDNNPSIDIYSVYAVGSSMDTKPDLAHMTEHAMFCTKDGAYDVLVKKYAEATNAYTRSEHTTYYTTNVKRENLSTVLAYEYRRMSELEVNQECFDYEHGRLEKELEDNHSLIHDWERDLRKLVFGTGYGGSPAVEPLQLADVTEFYGQWYQPNRAALVIVGSIGEENWKSILTRFGKLKNRTAPDFSISPVKPSKNTLDYPFGQERTSWLWRGPDISSPQSWLYWSLLGKTYLLDRNDSQVEVFMSPGFKGSVIELRATGPNGTQRLTQLHQQILRGKINEQRFAEAKVSFAKSLRELSLRTRPYFSLASELGYWAAWNQIPTILGFLDNVDKVSFAPSKKSLSFIDDATKIIMVNPKKDIGDIPTEPKQLADMAQIALESGDVLRAITCYERLLETNPGRINLVIYHYYLGNLYLEIGDKARAKDYLLKGLAIVEYPALRELLDEIDIEVPQQRGAAKVISVSERLSFDGEVPEWAERAAEVMEDIEKWRGLKFKDKVTITFQNTGDNIAGWYDHVTKELVVGDQGNKRFSEGVMLHELYHALQDQNFDLTKLESQLKSPDSIKALRAVIEGEAMLAVSEMMDYDFLSHVRYSPEMTDGQFRKFFDYGEGMKFVKAVKDSGGWDAVTQVYKEPPLSTKAILRSELYLAKLNQPQHLPHSVKLKRNEKLLRIESKGAYGWMWFLIQKANKNRDKLIALYEEDQFITVSSKGTTYSRWRVGFGSSKVAKKAANLLQSEDMDFTRKGRWLEIDIK